MTMKQEIISTSLEEFLKKGIRKMTVQNLVGPLGISTKTFYKYFTDKEDLLRACLADHYTYLFNQATATTEKYSNAATTLENMWKQAIDADFGVNRVFYYDLNYYYPALQDEILRTHGGKLEKVIFKLIRKGISEGLFRKELNPQVVFQALMVLYRSLTRTGDFMNFRMSPQELARQTVQVYMRGICTAKGLKHLKS